MFSIFNIISEKDSILAFSSLTWICVRPWSKTKSEATHVPSKMVVMVMNCMAERIKQSLTIKSEIGECFGGGRANSICLAILCTLFATVKRPFQGLSEVQIGGSTGHFESPIINLIFGQTSCLLNGAPFSALKITPLVVRYPWPWSPRLDKSVDFNRHIPSDPSHPKHCFWMCFMCSSQCFQSNFGFMKLNMSIINLSTMFLKNTLKLTVRLWISMVGRMISMSFLLWQFCPVFQG